MAIWDTFKSSIVAVGVGEATADAMKPILKPAEQDAWSKNPYRALDEGTAAELVAQGIITAAAGHEEASLTGVNTNRLDALVQLALTAPGTTQLLELWRRGAITEAQVDHGLQKASIEQQW